MARLIFLTSFFTFVLVLVVSSSASVQIKTTTKDDTECIDGRCINKPYYSMDLDSDQEQKGEMEKSYNDLRLINEYSTRLNKSAWFKTLEKSKRQTGGFQTAQFLNNYQAEGKNLRSNNNMHCVDPGQEYLETFYSDFQIFYRKRLEKMKVQKSLVLSMRRISSSNLIDNTQCNIEQRSTLGINQASVCPWRYHNSLSSDLFPMWRKQVKCTCDDCTLLQSDFTQRRKKSNDNGHRSGTGNVYGCLPVLRSEPVLTRGKCGSDGFYEWIPSTEQVNTACVCAYKKMLFPIL